MMDYILWLQIALFLLLMGLSGFFSSAETALFSLSGTRLEQMRREQHPRVGHIERMLSQPRRLIITILMGNELVNVAATAISATLIIETLGPGKKWINLFVMVPLLLVVGEITPKTLAIQHNVRFASFESYPVELFARLTKPLRWVVRRVAEWFITLIVGKERSRGNIITEDMVRTLAHEAVGEGALDSVEAQFIDHIFDFGDKRVEDVMVPRSSIFFLPLDMSVSQTVAELKRTRHTKVPIFQGRRDNIVGILHARDLLGRDLNTIASQAEGLHPFLREPYFVPESKPAVDLFHTFRKQRTSIALSVDEYGGVTGLVTMEDLLECIFGEIQSPSELHGEVGFEPLGNGRYGVDAAISIKVFNEQMGTKLPEKWGETVSGLLLHSFGELPSEGATVEIGELRFKVVEVRENRIRKVEFEQAGGSEDAEGKQLESVMVPLQMPVASEHPVDDNNSKVRANREGDKN
jgi:putative hemolysin